jgi:hypothetical protein
MFAIIFVLAIFLMGIICLMELDNRRFEQKQRGDKIKGEGQAAKATEYSEAIAGVEVLPALAIQRQPSSHNAGEYE